MFAYLVKRLLSGVVVVFLVSLSIFLLFWFGPSSPAQPICDRDTSNRCTPERLANFEENLGYNNPWYTEYGTFVKGVFVGREIQFGSTKKFDCPAPCLGYSYRTKTPVFEEMKERMPATFSVALGGAALYLILGIPIGVAAARRRGTLADKALVSSFLVLSSVPYYLFALLTWLFLTVQWEIPLFAETGYFPFTENPAKWFSGLLLAWIALGIFGCTQYTRYARGSMVEALSEDYIRTAKAKGLSQTKVVYKHGLRAALVPVVTIFGIDFGTLLAGTIFTERIFDIDGIGFWSLQAVNGRDLPVVSATALFSAIVLIFSNLIVDLIYSVLDPRVRLS
ncbi:ABC transporter permease [Nocardioides marmotae]|uniref:ABC transporter permease subunit n=1 Tax=Nocardioides marmotae TaxID=2663857 RepID=A0A6I3JGK6_9ACTN|nr:ABC transporter permease [Nocardioides marmotae]MCR6033766.1 ABC transporter permease subunit [Gordonia jinghuaiqii]MBC9733590.1 ABC transporter permease [Nocardioides marmotae]MTB84695.1 ABC transporter permease subunit [Nocardioides marmotae]MTB97424.1 ABC transporter permease subunit [Nocardioides marmotae]QKE01754.1 ABC transporter permease [Nocardioides marmotae]